jgi:hypothetical protein
VSARYPPRVAWEPALERAELEPILIVQNRRCHFKKRANDPETGRKRLGCERCGRAKQAREHLGAPSSFNAFGSGANQFAWQAQKRQWQEAITDLLREARLPGGLGGVFVEARVCFGDSLSRDQGNFRIVVEKAFGDALVDGGWIVDDDWGRYEFGRFELVRAAGQNWTEFAVFPRWPERTEELPGQQALLSEGPS